MLKNYKLDENGVITQINKNTIEYNKEYVVQRYDTYGTLNLSMSHLRLGNIIGSIGKIPESILDIGYGNGSFLQTASTVVKNCYGHDISGYPLPDGCDFVKDIMSKHFDVITFFDSLEHYENIYFVKNLNCNFVCITVPWCHHFDDEWFDSWKHRRPNEHLWHFSDISLVKFMDSQGYNMLSLSNIEDAVRKTSLPYQNILTGVFAKRK